MTMQDPSQFSKSIAKAIATIPWFKNLSIRYKLMTAFLLLAGIPFLAICWWSINGAWDSNRDQITLQMESIREIKQDQLNRYLKTNRRNLESLTSTAVILRQQAYAVGAGLGQDNATLTNQVDQYGYNDFYLINPQGQMIYSLKQQTPKFANVVTGPLAETGLGQAFSQSLETKQLAFVDFSIYSRNNDSAIHDGLISFIAHPILNAQGQVKMVGVAKLPIDGINAIMTTRFNMGKTGESYLVGPDYLMRSDSFLDPQNRSVIASLTNPDSGTITTTMVLAALAGETSSKLFRENYTGIESYTGFSWRKTFGLLDKHTSTISAYTPIDVYGEQWALMVERDGIEASSKLMDLYFQMYWIGGVAAILILIVAYYITLSLTLPICYLAAQVGRIEQSSDFSMRLEWIPSNKDEAGQAAHAINRLMNSLQAALGESNRVVADIAQGHFSSRIEDDFKGDLLRLKDGVNASASSVEKTMHSLEQVMKAIAEGNFGYRLEGVEMTGEFRTVMENTLNVMEQAMGEINQVMQAVSKGDFDLRVSAPLKGDLDKLKSGVNNSISTIATALKETVEVSEAMAQGDLTQRIDGNYQGSLARLKDALNSSLDKMNQAVGSVLVASEGIAANAGEISRGSEQLSKRTNQQSASLQETSASMEQMAATIELNAEHANVAGKLVASGKNEATGGVVVVQQAVEAMGQIDEASKKIASIINLIDGIAFQTNLLALNAAVEAARAGDHGRGFAVVAGEVRSLAQKAAQSANEIKLLIEDSSTKVKEGSHLVDKTGKALNSIAQSIEEVNDIVTEIAAATNEQSSVINQVNKAVAELEEVNQLNTALVEESSHSSLSLNDQTDDLITKMNFFKG